MLPPFSPTRRPIERASLTCESFNATAMQRNLIAHRMLPPGRLDPPTKETRLSPKSNGVAGVSRSAVRTDSLAMVRATIARGLDGVAGQEKLHGQFSSTKDSEMLGPAKDGLAGNERGKRPKTVCVPVSLACSRHARLKPDDLVLRQ